MVLFWIMFISSFYCPVSQNATWAFSEFSICNNPAEDNLPHMGAETLMMSSHEADISFSTFIKLPGMQDIPQTTG